MEYSHSARKRAIEADRAKFGEKAKLLALLARQYREGILTAQDYVEYTTLAVLDS